MGNICTNEVDEDKTGMKNKKDVLIISNLFPFPPYQNGETSTLFNLLESEEIKQYNVDLLYLEAFDNKNEYVLENQVRQIYRRSATGKEYRLFMQGKNYIKPRGLWNICEKNFDVFDASKYDILIFGSWAEACLLDKIVNPKAYKIIFAADSPSLNYATKNDNTKNLFYRLYNNLQKKMWLPLEKIMSKAADKIVFVSDKDANLTKEYLDSSKVKVARIGVKEVKNNYNVKSEDVVDIGFSGIMTYEPNRCAVDYIINSIIPELNRRGVNYRMHIIGKDPDSRWISYAEGKDNIIITGFVDDIDSYISKLDLYISPLFQGSGMKNKILQALSIGVPIIASQVSVDGIDGMKNNYNFLLCDADPVNWVDMIENLYQNMEKRRMFSLNGKQLVKEDYSWNRFAKDLLQ